MKRWRSELVVALLAATSTVAVLQYRAWRELSALRLDAAAAEQRLRQLAPVTRLGDAYDAARKSLEMRLRVLESIEPRRWRLWVRPPGASAGRPSGRDTGESRAPDGGARLAELMAALAKGPAIERLGMESGRLEVSFAAASPGAIERLTQELRRHGLITGFTISESDPAGGTLRAVLDESYASPGVVR
jgi:hypothetical protein